MLLGVVIFVFFFELSIPPGNVAENEVLITEKKIDRGEFNYEIHLDTGHYRFMWYGAISSIDSDLLPATAPGQPTPTPAPNIPFTPERRAKIIRSLRALDRYSTWFSSSSSPIHLEYRLNGTLHRFDFQKPPPPEFGDVENALYSNQPGHL